MPPLHQDDDRINRELVETVAPILERSAQLGFLGGMPIPEQIDHALGFSEAAEAQLGRAPHSALDLGTGGGIPGLVLAAVWPDVELTLFDANQRRTDFLSEEVEAWGVSARVKILRGRAEEAGRIPELRDAFELITARSFGSPAVTAECAAPLLEAGGILVVSEPPGASPAERWPVKGLAIVGLAPGAFYRHQERFGYQVLEKTAETPDKFPRRTGIPTKRPLF
ncbi:MAG TPA: RsmG family class I SAM-dependent methyltransferase [Acidimicrobiales bacterium]|jgi:16S rRNA (guanine527-N7)-methyltransferase|nr:RsmG family class I SAM-dependent methyltransferase [Acidimicrobiales bacterium]